MTTELIAAQSAKNGILYAVTPETIAVHAAAILALTIKSVDDEAGILAVKTQLRAVVGWRTSVEETRKQIKAEPWALCKRIDAEAEEVQALIVPLEKHLKDQREAVDAQLKKLAKIKEDELYKVRLQRLTEAGGEIAEDIVRLMPDEVFDVAVEQAQARTTARLAKEAQDKANELERKRVLDEQAEANRVQQAQLTADREAFEARQREAQAETDWLKKIDDDLRAEQAATLKRQQDELQAERNKLDRANQASLRLLIGHRREALTEVGASFHDDVLGGMTNDEFTTAVSLGRLAQEQARQDQIEADRIEAENKAQREAEEATEQAAAALRLEQLQPLKLRLQKFAERVRTLAPAKLPEDVRDVIEFEMATCAGRILAVAGGLK